MNHMEKESKQIYSDEQLLNMANNFKSVHLKLVDVFYAIGKSEEEGMALHEILQDTKLSAFVRDKSIAALELPGLIIKDGIGNEKICRLTNDGKRLKELLKLRGGK